MASPNPTASQLWPDLRCFQHCDRNVNIICCFVPPACPLCGCDTGTTAMRIPPYILPSPFVKSTQAPCSIVLRPTLGDFVRNYTKTADLHIGVTDTAGLTYDFDEEGVHCSGVWDQCISINLLERVSAGLAASDWDFALRRFSDPTVWTSRRYSENDCNCFDFVLQFLRYMKLQRTLGNVVDKQSFCDQLLQQQTMKAAQYVNLYRRVLGEGCVLDAVKS